MKKKATIRDSVNDVYGLDERIDEHFKQAYDLGFSSGIAHVIELMDLERVEFCDFVNKNGKTGKKNELCDECKGWNMAIAQMTEILDALTKLKK